MAKGTAIICICLLAAVGFACAEDNDGENRKKKLLPVFQVVRFPNDPCVVSGGSKNGTCYTAEECSNKGGTNGGSCAEGFGVCCQFSLGCGSSTTENCTYFEITNAESTAGACTAKICKASDDICMLRLDLSTFVITGPATSTTSIGSTIGGQLGTTAGTDDAATYGRCLTDSFVVSNQANLPIMCGTMTGEHVYVQASDACNDLTFQFGAAAYEISAVATRSISIKVSQISCFDENKPPDGCDQWYFGNSGTGYIETFNYANTIHLAAQAQDICIRREKSNCKICYSADAVTDIKIGGDGSAGVPNSLSCCGAGSKGTKTVGADCLVIPGATKDAGATPSGTVSPQYQCGGGEGITHAGAVTTVCSKRIPFRISFWSDEWEFAAIEAAKGSTGFKIRYFQKAC